MAEADFRGARGSNAGDDFHELWALRQALTLLDQDAGLTAVTVEGIKAEDEKATDPATWDGVDCALYYGGDQIDSVKRIVISQLKYSAANPSQKWTVSRLTKSSNKKKENSVIGRLAKAFTGLKKKRPDLVEGEHLLIRLVSNQPLDPMVVNILSGETSSKNSSSERSKNESNRTALLQASGLQDEEFEAFTQALDFSECGHQSRFAIEERVLTTISDWTEDDARLDVEHLMRFVRRAMMPEAKEEFITRHSILAQLGFSDPAALFPCPPALKHVGELVPRKVSQSIVQKMSKGEQRICLHGEGGCGKTTVLQEIEALLPKDSILIIFDCYGSGRYLESDAYRHRPADAFLQLSNDLARLLRTPLLLSRSKDLDYPRQFKKRLERAAEVVSSRSADALLVIVVDAADNSVTAADACSPQEKSFVHDFMSLGNLPKNVRLLITARTGRLSSLQLPHGLLQLEMKGFERDETATHVREVWQSAPDTWVDDFDHLSNGNPRVQRYALDYAGTKPVRAIEYLRPNGKGLEQIFQEQLRYALRKEGGEQSIKTFCAGIVALPRPIPIAVLAAVTELDEARLHDLCADLAPGVRLVNFSVGFADEDFEHFVREEAKDHIRSIQIRIADYFLKLHKSDAYAATHVASALLVADRRQDILDLINEEQELQSVSDPVLRREVQLQRLRIAMKVCRETGNHVDAILTLLTGAEALKTDATIQRLFIEHPDLAAPFARQSAGRTILRDPQKMEHHGPLLFHLMAADAHEGNAISVREGHRQIRAWLQRREEDFEEQRGRHLGLNPQGWDLHDRDIAAQTEAVLRIEGPQSGITSLLRWTPKPLRLNVAHLLSCKLISIR